MLLDQGAPILYAGAQLAFALVLAGPAVFVRSLRRPVKLALVTALLVFVLVLTLVLTFDLTLTTGRPSLGATLLVGGLGGVIWGTMFFVLAYVPLAMLALLRIWRRGL